MERIGRRWFLLGGATALTVPCQLLADKNDEHVRRFGTPSYDVRMTVEFHDRYASPILGFQDRITNQHFCLSANGTSQRCVKDFVGAIAVARYRIRARSKDGQARGLRERVRTIDQDERIDARPSFDRAIEFCDGVASDIQAFGYVADGAPADDVWCLYRQDLFLDNETSPFLVVHWKHTLNSIRILDIVEGPGTREERAR